MKHLTTFLGTLSIIALIVFGVGCSDDSGTNPEPVPEPGGYHGWAVGRSADGFGTIIHTVNSGTTWVRQGNAGMIPDVDINDITAVDSLNAWAVGSYEGGYATILRTTDGGDNWIRQGSAASIPNVELEGVSAVSVDIAWAAGDSGVILKTVNGGGTWNRQAETIPAQISFGMIHAVNSDIVWAGGGWAGTGVDDSVAVVFRTSDGGDTWVRKGEADILPDPGWVENYFIDIHALNENIAWAVGEGGCAFVTTDGGENWLSRPTPIGISHNNGVCAVTEMKAWIAADYANLLFTDNMGDSWVHQTVPVCSVGTGYFMGITAADENRAWMVSANFGSGVGGGTFHTIDGGDTWVRQDSPVNSPLRRVSFVGALK